MSWLCSWRMAWRCHATVSIIVLHFILSHQTNSQDSGSSTTTISSFHEASPESRSCSLFITTTCRLYSLVAIVMVIVVEIEHRKERAVLKSYFFTSSKGSWSPQQAIQTSAPASVCCPWKWFGSEAHSTCVCCARIASFKKTCSVSCDREVGSLSGKDAASP